jgi:hypothetical protein
MFEESLSLVEKTSLKFIPILQELMVRLVPEKKIEGKQSLHDVIEEDEEQADMHNILGFLNQNEWVYSLNIGNIMQIGAYNMQDLLQMPRNEAELSRDSFLEKISIIAISYFCVSTEIRFIIQLKEDPSYDPVQKGVESEYWHAKSLEVACSFLPSECPLLNHVLLSY